MDVKKWLDKQIDASTFNGYVNQLAVRKNLELAITQLLEALVEAGIPLEALRAQPSLDYLSAEVRQGIVKGTDAIRAALAELNRMD